MSDKKEVIPSPCISVCLLDNNDMCVGCYRTAEEIGQWMNGDNAIKQEILQKARQRMQADQLHGLR